MLWIQRDPLGRIPGANEYAYCLGELVDFYDPMGLWFEQTATKMVNSDSAAERALGWAIGIVGGAGEGAARGAAKEVEGAGKLAKESVLVIVDGVGLTADTIALTAGYNLDYHAQSQWGQHVEHGGSWSEVGIDTALFAGEAALAMVTAGSSEIVIGVIIYAGDGDADALSERMGGVAAANLIAAEAARGSGRPSTEKSCDGGDIKPQLDNHAEKAVKRFEREGFTDRQSARIKSNPELEAAFRGERIDAHFRESVLKDPNLRQLQLTPRGKFGPDVIDPTTGIWYDVTTRGQWGRHVAKYGPRYGKGVPLFYQ